MREVKNPFAIRDGQIITIEDVPDSERGFACNSFCPNCGQRFQARIGKERIPHFAHEEGACDSVVSVMKGLYKLLVQGILMEGYYRYPDCYAYSRFPQYAFVSETDGEKYIYVSSEAEHGYSTVIRSEIIPVSDIDIIYNSKDIPEAALITYQEHKLALVIVQPSSICKTYNIKPYKDYSTVIVNHPIDLYHTSSQDMFKEMINNQFWLSSPLLRAWGLNAVKKHNLEEEKRRDAIQQRKKHIEEFTQSLNQQYSTLTSLPKEPVTDPETGTKFGFCPVCCKWFPSEECYNLGNFGMNVNICECRTCYHQEQFSNWRH